jgi:hypothetical protein
MCLKKEEKKQKQVVFFTITEMNELQLRVLDENDAIGYNNNNYFNYKREREKEKKKM